MAVAHFDAADNMTDTVAALAALKDGDTPERDALFERFEAQWRDEPLVLDKWFALEATSARADTLARVKRLLAHPRFNAQESQSRAFACRRVRAAQFRALPRSRRRAATPLPRTRYWRSIPPTRNWRPPSPARSTCGSAFPSRAAG